VLPSEQHVSRYVENRPQARLGEPLEPLPPKLPRVEASLLVVVQRSAGKKQIVGSDLLPTIPLREYPHEIGPVRDLVVLDYAGFQREAPGLEE